MMKSRRISSTVLFLSVLLSLSCQNGETRQGEGTTDAQQRQAARDAKPITVKGSDTMVILGQRFAEEYMKRNPGAVVQVNGGGSGTGIAALINGTVDLAQSSRPMKNDEKELVRKNRSSAVVETPVALDALAVFMHKTNPVAVLSIEQLKGIYQGKIKNWSALGGKDAQIILYGRENSSGTYEYFKEHVLDKEDYASAVQTLQGTAAVVNAISKDPNGIGYGGIAYESNVKLAGVKKDAGTAAVSPSEATAADGTYPISRELYLYHTESASDAVKGFVAWMTSDDGQAVVKDVGYFPLPKIAASSATDGTGATPSTDTSSTQ